MTTPPPAGTAPECKTCRGTGLHIDGCGGPCDVCNGNGIVPPDEEGK